MNRTPPTERLAALAAHLSARRLEVELTAHGLCVADPEVPGCCPEAGPATVVITCRERIDDDGRMWFFGPGHEPIAEADPDRTATDLKQWLPGTSVWFGRSTCTWRSLARDRAGENHLVEAATPAELVRRLDRLEVRRAIPPAASKGRAPAPRYSRARLAAAPDVTVPDLAHVAAVAAAPVGPHQSRHRAPRRGWLRSAFVGLVAN